MVLNVHRNHKAYLGRGAWGDGGMEVGEEGEYIPIATLSPPERPALRWAAMRAILMFRQEVTDKVTRQCPQTTTFEEKGEPKRYRTEVLPFTSLTPYR